jgi:RNA polymerase primary sigma factor
MQEIKTLEERKNELLELGKKEGHITYEQLAESLKGLEVEPDDLDELYNLFMINNIEIISENEDSEEDGGDEPII